MRDVLVNVFFRLWYKVVCLVDKKSEVTFMNYGYSSKDHEIFLEPHDAPNLYSAKLYNYLLSSIDLSDKNLLEVGCGRGGGLSYVNRYLKPQSATGVDLNDKAIEFCQKNYSNQNINFVVGNAETLLFDSNMFDVVINVESSHRYTRFDKFLAESFRILKPNGYLLITDFRFAHQVDLMHNQILDSEFSMLSREVITPNVVEALTRSSDSTQQLIKNMAPRFLHGIAGKFAGLEGSSTFRKFATGEYEYMLYVLQKK
jgi:ubiquinone/menaquinone biosynthesis C-methylase UbiE